MARKLIVGDKVYEPPKPPAPESPPAPTFADDAWHTTGFFQTGYQSLEHHAQFGPENLPAGTYVCTLDLTPLELGDRLWLAVRTLSGLFYSVELGYNHSIHANGMIHMTAPMTLPSGARFVLRQLGGHPRLIPWRLERLGRPSPFSVAGTNSAIVTASPPVETMVPFGSIEHTFSPAHHPALE